MSNIVKAYVILVKAGWKPLDAVPSAIRQEVESALAAEADGA